jgi:hypothetical protein
MDHEKLTGDILKEVHDEKIYTLNILNAVTSIKQSSVLNSHPFLVMSYTISYELNLF